MLRATMPPDAYMRLLTLPFRADAMLFFAA